LQLLYAALFNPLSLWRREHFDEPVVTVRTVLGTSVIVNEPTMVKRVLIDNAANYVRDRLQQRILVRMTGRSVFLANDADWRVQRKALAPFFSAKALASYLSGMIAAAEDAAGSLRTANAEGIVLGREMAALTVDVLGRTIFTPGLGQSPDIIATSVRRYTDVNGPVELGDLFRLPPWLPGVRRLLGWRATDRVRKRARRLIAEAKSARRPPDGDIVSALLAARTPETGSALDAQVIESNVSTLIGAGSDTVAVALTWAIFLLSQAPQVREAVEAEVDAHLMRGPLTLEALDKLVWTRAVIEEAMRLYPPTPVIGRMACGDDDLGGECVPAGATILISPWVIHRHTRLWDEPDMFEPERFLPGRREHIPRFAYLPFGAGPRICLGMGFAMQEAVALLATLVGHVRFERSDNSPVRLCQRFTLQTEAPLRMRISARREQT
jgi:cytochrome P450